MEEVHASFRSFVARHLGSQGRTWLAGLGPTLESLRDAWTLTLGPELPGGVLACVHAVTTGDGLPAVLKVAGPWDRPGDEIACLRRWDGNAAPVLIRADPERGAMLLERIEPGSPAVSASATEVAAVLRHLQTAPLAAFRPLGAVARGRVRRALAQERTTPYKAEWGLARIDELEREAPAPVLLHGDFDERNLLVCNRRGLAAIDPLPCAGDPAYDAGHWAHANGRPGRRARTTEIAEALGLPLERVRGWCAVAAIHG